MAPLMMAPSFAIAARKEAPKFIISDLELVHVHINKRGNWVIPRLKTSNGLSGLGDASQSTNDGECIQFLKQYAGDAARPQHLRHRMVSPCDRSHPQRKMAAISAAPHLAWRPARSSSACGTCRAGRWVFPAMNCSAGAYRTASACMPTSTARPKTAPRPALPPTRSARWMTVSTPSSSRPLTTCPPRSPIAPSWSVSSSLASTAPRRYAM